MCGHVCRGGGVRLRIPLSAYELRMWKTCKSGSFRCELTEPQFCFKMMHVNSLVPILYLTNVLRKHNLSLNSTVGDGITYPCIVKRVSLHYLYKKTSIIGRFHKKRNREISEAFSIFRPGEHCVSQPAVALTDKEIAFLQTYECG